MDRRSFLQLLAAAAASGMALPTRDAQAETSAASYYEAPAFGNVSLLHITDCHAQLNPIYFREPNVNLGIGSMRGQVPHLVGDYFLNHFNFKANTLDKCNAAWRLNHQQYYLVKVIIGTKNTNYPTTKFTHNCGLRTH